MDSSRSILEREILIPDYYEDKNKVYYSISHGKYPSAVQIERHNMKDTFNIPHNIRLIQFTRPGQQISYLQALYILDQYRINNIGNIDNKYIVGGKLLEDKYKLLNEQYSNLIYETDVTVNVVEPGKETLNLVLSFNDTRLPLYEAYLVNTKETVLSNTRVPSIEDKSLEYHLYQISKEISELEDYDGYILNVIQLSCKQGYVLGTSVGYITELLSSSRIKNTYLGLDDLYRRNYDNRISINDFYKGIKDGSLGFKWFDTEEEAIQYIDELREIEKLRREIEIIDKENILPITAGIKRQRRRIGNRILETSPIRTIKKLRGGKKNISKLNKKKLKFKKTKKLYRKRK